VLELGTHEAIAIARVFEDQEVQLKHRHIKQNGNDDETECPSPKVFDPEFRRETDVTQERPQLFDRTKSHCRDCKEAHPLATRHCTEREARQQQPKPPSVSEWLVLVFVTEADPKEDGKRSEENEWRVEEDEA